MIKNLHMPRYINKLISIIVIITFILTNTTLSYAGVQKALFTQTSIAQRHIITPDLLEDITQDPSLLSIPKSLGKVVEYHKADSKDLVVYIQDRHIDAITQSNIADILKHLNQVYNIHLVCLEGAAKALDTSFYDDIEYTPSKQRVARFFLEKGLFTGAEYFKITQQDLYARLSGVEDPSLYYSHVKAYHNNAMDKQAVLQMLYRIKASLQRLKQVIYNKELREIDNLTRAFHDGQIGFADYALRLWEYAENKDLDTSAYDELAGFIAFMRKEKNIDFDAAEQERDNLIQELSDKMSSQKARELLAMSVDLRFDRISDIAFNAYLEFLINEYNLDITRFENLTQYIAYTRQAKTINHLVVFEQAESAESVVKQAFCTTRIQRELLGHDKAAGLLEDLLKLELTPRKLEHLKTNSHAFTLDAILRFVQTASYTYNQNLDIPVQPEGPIMAAMQSAQEYYALAVARDRAMAANTIKSMEQYRTDRSVLVAGGFHTQGITRILRQNNISYIVVCPIIGKDKCDQAYRNRMNNGLLDSADIEEFFTHTLAPPAIIGDLSQGSLSAMQGLFVQAQNLFELLLSLDTLRNDPDSRLLADDAYRDMVLNLFIDKLVHALGWDKGSVSGRHKQTQRIGYDRIKVMYAESVKQAPAAYSRLINSVETGYSSAADKASSAGKAQDVLLSIKAQLMERPYLVPISDPVPRAKGDPVFDAFTTKDNTIRRDRTINIRAGFCQSWQNQFRDCLM